MNTIRELREARGESRQHLAAAIGGIPEEVTAWEMGKAEKIGEPVIVLGSVARFL